MEEQLVSFETAVKAKEKGFNEKSKMYGSQNIPQIENYNETKYNIYRDYYFAPTQSLLQKWLRDIHNIDVTVKPFIKVVVKVGYHYEINSKTDYGSNIAQTYEQALEVGLQKALNLINNGTDTNNS